MWLGTLAVSISAVGDLSRASAELLVVWVDPAKAVPALSLSPLMWILKVNLARDVRVYPLKHGGRACRCVPLPDPRGDQYEDVHRPVGSRDGSLLQS